MERKKEKQTGPAQLTWRGCVVVRPHRPGRRTGPPSIHSVAMGFLDKPYKTANARDLSRPVFLHFS
jgi:hypothetical protein